jgi:hypothetical protein
MSNGESFYANGAEITKVAKGFMTLCMAEIANQPSHSILKKTFDKKALYSVDPGTSTPNKAVSSSSAAKVKARRASIATTPSMVNSTSAPALNITKDAPTPLLETDDLIAFDEPVKEKKKRRMSLVFGK